MGEQEGPGLATHTFNGTWSGGFFGNGEKDDRPPRFRRRHLRRDRHYGYG